MRSNKVYVPEWQSPRNRNLLSSKGLLVYRPYGWRRQSQQYLGTLLEFNGMKCGTSCQLNKNLVLEKGKDSTLMSVFTRLKRDIKIQQNKLRL